MKEVFKTFSTNGRWGMAIVAQEDTSFPAEGKIEHKGRVGGISTYLFTPGNTGTWVLPIKTDIIAYEGCITIEAMDLQSSRYVSLLLLSKKAIFKQYGYKHRSSWISYYRDGKLVELPSTVLVAMGLIKGEGKIIDIPTPPDISPEVDKILEDNYMEEK